MLEFTLIAGLFWLTWRIRKAARRPQTGRLDVHVFVHYDGGPGEQLSIGEPLSADDNVIAFPSKRAA
jgi:hypothetical protein